MKKLFFALVCAVAIFATTSCGGGASTPADAAAECIELIKAGDYEGFVDNLYFGEEVTAEEADQAKQMYLALLKEKGGKQMEQKGGITSYTLASEEIAEDGKTAKVAYETTYGDGSTDKMNLDLILVDGEWKPTIIK